MRITCLIENTASREACATEHGLSLLVEANGRRVLFDAGQTGAAMTNAQLMGINLESVDTAVLSHGHYDHANGFPAFFRANAAAPVYVHAGFDLPHWHGSRDIGVAPEVAESGRIRIASTREELGDGLSIVSYSELEPTVAIDADGLEEEGAGGRVPERFLHEQYLLVREGNVTLLLTGCSHRGITNIMRWTSGEGVTHVIGGFHLMRTPPESPRIEQVAQELLGYPTRYLTCHCTGQAQYQRLKQLMGERLEYVAAGDVVEL